MSENKIPFTVDLRSDTVTKPSAEMLEAMMNAEVGDDVFEEDPTVKALENKLALMFGKEAGLFCPSGTMTNQIALNILSKPGQELICEATSHVYLYEVGGLAFNSGLSVNLIDADRGLLNVSLLEGAYRKPDIHRPDISVVSIENTHNRGGGSIYKLNDLKEISGFCKKHNFKMHLDGARIFNALTAADYSAKEIGGYFDTISVSMCKGLGAPVGSVLLSTNNNIYEGRRVRKVLGGGMRQSGYLAAAGIYALDHNLSILKKDHERAAVLADTLSGLSFTAEILKVETNIVITKLNNNVSVDTLLNNLSRAGIKAVPFGPQKIRMVTHLDIDDDKLDYTCNVLKSIELG